MVGEEVAPRPGPSRRQVIGGLAALAGAALAPGCSVPPPGSTRFPPPLPADATVGICAPSAGVPRAVVDRYRFSVSYLESLGYRVVTAGRIITDEIVSAPAEQRAEALQSLLFDPRVDVVVPPWGGELLIDILPLVDWDALRQTEPTWVVGYSDLSTFQLPYLLNADTASVVGSNLLETPIRPPARGLEWWPDVVSLPAGATFTQRSAPRYQASDVDWEQTPTTTHFDLDTRSWWEILGREGDRSAELSVTGRVVVGTIDVLAPLVGTPYGDVPRFAQRVSPERLIIGLDAADFQAAQYGRALWGLRMAGWFDSAAAIVLGRTAAQPVVGFSARDAADDALRGLDVPVVYNADLGHLPPQMAWVLGARAALDVVDGGAVLRQTLA